MISNKTQYHRVKVELMQSCLWLSLSYPQIKLLGKKKKKKKLTAFENVLTK